MGGPPWPLVLGLVLALCTCCHADVYIMTNNYNLEPVADLPADFGPDIPEVGVEGYLKSADPEDACQPFRFKDFTTSWVALISRNQQMRSTNCTFDIKVRNAQAAGAIAAIVYDDVFESLIIMSKPRGHPDPDIPSVFVTQRSGQLMKKLMTLDIIRVRLVPASAIAWLSMVMSAFLGLLALTVVLATFYVMRSWSLWISGNAVPRGHNVAPGGGPGRPQPEGGLPASSLRALPVIMFEASGGRPGSQSLSSKVSGHTPNPNANLPDVYSDALEESASCHASSNSSEAGDAALPPGVHAGETKRTCAVCLEHYVEGEKIRILPCRHRFHMTCVDQWLSTRRVCPVCKHDASQQLAPPAQPTLGDSSRSRSWLSSFTGLQQQQAQHGRSSAWPLQLLGSLGARLGLGHSGSSGEGFREPLLQPAGEQQQGNGLGPAAGDVEAGMGVASGSQWSGATPGQLPAGSSGQEIAAAPRSPPITISRAVGGDGTDDDISEISVDLNPDLISRRLPPATRPATTASSAPATTTPGALAAAATTATPAPGVAAQPTLVAPAAPPAGPSGELESSAASQQ